MIAAARDNQRGQRTPSGSGQDDMSQLSHLDRDGQPRMVDVAAKPVTVRSATAAASVYLNEEAFALAVEGVSAKGNVFAVARIAGIMAAKRTAELIPLCHPLPLSHVSVDFDTDAVERCIRIRATCHVSAQTGVEMEAMTAASVAALTIYDMCKAVDRTIRIADLRLIAKSGGRSGSFVAA